MAFQSDKKKDFVIQEVKEENDIEIELDDSRDNTETNLRLSQNTSSKTSTINFLNQNKQILLQIKEEFGSISVGLTGANGYLGSYILRELLSLDYKVIAGISHSSETEDLKFINRLQKDFPEKLIYRQFDMTKKEECEELVKNCHVIIHCATIPRNKKVEHPINILYPEIEGVLNLLTCAQKFKIRRFILMGSVSNTAAGKYKKVYNESHWAHPDDCDDYERAKLFVERTAWNFVEENGSSINLTVFLPGLIIGPLLRKGVSSASVVFIKKLIDDDFNQILDLKIPVVDVRDVSRIIVKSIEKPEAFGQRYLLVEGVYGLDEIYKIIQHDVNPSKFKKLNVFSKIYIRFLAFFDQDLRKIIEFYGKNFKFDNEKSRRELQMNYSPFDQSIGAMVVSLEKYKMIEYSNNRVNIPGVQQKSPLFD